MTKEELIEVLSEFQVVCFATLGTFWLFFSLFSFLFSLYLEKRDKDKK